ncbi:hypothetical protein C9Y86_23815, partial [Escherichia coli]
MSRIAACPVTGCLLCEAVPPILQGISLHIHRTGHQSDVNRPGFPGECFICELRLPDHRFRWKH